MGASKVKVADGLPEECFAVVPGEDELVVIVRGERGYHLIEERTQGLLRHRQTVQDSCNRLNADAGVTKAQAAAMLSGSICGWVIPGADPANYNRNGRLKR